MELFDSAPGTEEEPVTGGVAQDFSVYCTESVELELEPEDVFALKDKPTKLRPPRREKGLIYKISRKRSAKQKHSE